MCTYRYKKIGKSEKQIIIVPLTENSRHYTLENKVGNKKIRYYDRHESKNGRPNLWLHLKLEKVKDKSFFLKSSPIAASLLLGCGAGGGTMPPSEEAGCWLKFLALFHIFLWKVYNSLVLPRSFWGDMWILCQKDGLHLIFSSFWDVVLLPVDSAL